MFQSVCILGRQPALGIAELESLYGAAAVSLLSSHVAGLTLDPSEITFSRLGGSTRLGRVLAIVPNNLWKDVEKQLTKSLVELANTLPEGKLQLGISVYDIPVTPAKLMATGLTLKKVVRAKAGRSLRLTPNKELELNTAQVLHNRLTGPLGVEFLICATAEGNTVIAQTTAVQDIDSYTLRDRGRPKRDARVGMLPPKLAQTIINLATGPVTAGDGYCVLDPFCGTGVVLQEALLMGFEAIGTDIDERMVAYTDQNLEWLDEMHHWELPAHQAQVGDATDFQWDRTLQPSKTPPVFEFVACEAYLGRPFTTQPTREVVEQTVSEVNLILKKFLRNIQPQLASGTRLCLAVPAWQLRPHEFRHLPLVDSLEEMGYNREKFEHVLDSELLYYREDQVVARQLLVLTRK